MTHDQFVDIVELGCDAGIRFSEAVPLDMVAVPIGMPQRFVVAGSPAFVARHGMPTDPLALLAQPCVKLRFPSGVLYRWEFERAGQRHELNVNGPLTVDDQQLAQRAALDGVGWAYLYESSCAPHIASGALVAVLTNWCPPATAFQLYYPSRRQTSTALRAFIGWVQAGHGQGI